MRADPPRPENIVAMCGIAGFWLTKEVEENPLEVLERMGQALTHRGPDDSGNFFDNGTGLGLAFRRLSIIDLSPEGHQPMRSASGRYTLIFNGEVYNFQEIRSELGPQPWRGHSDSEVILAAIERWGLVPALRRFVGMFAFAVWDSHERQLFLVRDRLGIKPLFYGRIGGHFVFGSEMKALEQFPGFNPVIDRNVLALYMRFNYVPSPHSIYEDIYKLKPGHVLTLRAGAATPEIVPYWSAVEVARAGNRSLPHADDREVLEQLEEKLRDAVRLRMIADVPLGAFLSGGIDSSAVVALMQSQSTRPVKTFSIGFHEARYNEADHAKKVAKHLHTDHTELYVTPTEAQEVVSLLPAMYDEPFADSSQVPTYLVSKLARQHVTVGLSGDGGDELFCGYFRYTRLKQIWKFARRVPRPIARRSGKIFQSLSWNAVDRALGRMPGLPLALQPSPGQKLHKLGRVLQYGTVHSMYLDLLSQWAQPSSVVLRSTEPDTVASVLRALDWLPAPEEQAMLTDLINYLPDDILTKVDRASMAVSLEARVPLLDHRLVEFAWQLPLRFKVRDGVQKWALRQVLYKFVPPQLVERPKMGFGVPIDSWLRGPLRAWAEDLLAPEQLRRDGFFDVHVVRETWEQHASGTRNWDYKIWTVLMFQDWLRRAESRRRAPLSHDVMV